MEVMAVVGRGHPVDLQCGRCYVSRINYQVFDLTDAIVKSGSNNGWHFSHFSSLRQPIDGISTCVEVMARVTCWSACMAYPLALQMAYRLSTGMCRCAVL